MAKFSALRERISKLPEDEQNEIIAMFERATAAKSTPAPTEREIAADHRDLVRTLNKVLKPQTPSPYKGEHDADASQNFIDNQEEYYRVVKLSEDQWVQYTALNLTDEAKSWWRASGLAINTSWATFKKEFLDFFTPPNAVSAARNLSRHYAKASVQLLHTPMNSATYAAVSLLSTTTLRFIGT